MNVTTYPASPCADTPARKFYLHCLSELDRCQVPHLIGGGYAMGFYTSIARDTKDLDLFIRRADRDRALTTLSAAGYQTDVPWPHFLAKVRSAEAFVDFLYNSGNGLSPVDDAWFQHAIAGQVLGRPVLLCPVEEIIWSKAFVMDRERFDGADIAHLLLARGRLLDWPRLLKRFAGHKQVLLAHLLLFQYTYPSEAGTVPQPVIQELLLSAQSNPPQKLPICRGTSLAPTQYESDIERRGFIDVRLNPAGPLSARDIHQFKHNR